MEELKVEKIGGLKRYVKLGNKLIEVDENNVIKVTSREIRNKTGGIDVEIHIPFLKVQTDIVNK